MRFLVGTTVILMTWASVASASEKDEGGVRRQAARYLAALRKGDKAGLEALLHKEYQARRLPGVHTLDTVARAQAISQWASPAARFSRLTTEVESIRIFGQTAIETGALSGELQERGFTHTWKDVTYTRVWVETAKGWQLVHEQY